MPWRRRPAGGKAEDPFWRDYPWMAGFLAGNLYYDEDIDRAVEELASQLPPEAVDRTIGELELVIARIEPLWPAVVDWGNRTYNNAAETKAWLEQVLSRLKASRRGAGLGAP